MDYQKLNDNIREMGKLLNLSNEWIEMIIDMDDYDLLYYESNHPYEEIILLYIKNNL